MSERVPVEPAAERRIWIVEDEPAAGALATELCESVGAAATLFRAPLPFLTALRMASPPDVVVLDWRLENELSAALFLAVRHRAPELPVVYWTGNTRDSLPTMILADANARVVDKAAGTVAFERALAWALGERPA